MEKRLIVFAAEGYDSVVARNEEEALDLFDDGDEVGIYELVDTARVVNDKRLVIKPKRGRPRKAKNGKS